MGKTVERNFEGIDMFNNPLGENRKYKYLQKLDELSSGDDILTLNSKLIDLLASTRELKTDYDEELKDYLKETKRWYNYTGKKEIKTSILSEINKYNSSKELYSNIDFHDIALKIRTELDKIYKLSHDCKDPQNRKIITSFYRVSFYAFLFLQARNKQNYNPSSVQEINKSWISYYQQLQVYFRAYIRYDDINKKIETIEFYKRSNLKSFKLDDVKYEITNYLDIELDEKGGKRDEVKASNEKTSQEIINELLIHCIKEGTFKDPDTEEYYNFIHTKNDPRWEKGDVNMSQIAKYAHDCIEEIDIKKRQIKRKLKKSRNLLNEGLLKVYEDDLKHNLHVLYLST